MKKYIEYIRSSRINGGFLASPTYLPYKRVWLRDHSFITLALLGKRVDITEEIIWLKRILEKEAPKIKNLMEMRKEDKKFLNQEYHPRARYTPYFETFSEPWSERQYDGVALALATIITYELVKKEEVLSKELKSLYQDYLLKVFDTPCADLWEMHDDYIHVETLGSIYFALKQRVKQLRKGSKDWIELNNFLDYLKDEILKFEFNGKILKMKKTLQSKPKGLDSSVLLLFTVFEVIKEKDLLFNTLRELYYHLSPDELGLRRFIIEEEKDVYFGGGVWYITTYWAAEAFNIIGEKNKYEQLRYYRYRFPMPEQLVEGELIFSMEGKEFWIKKSKEENNGIPGPAEPLTWSISEYLRIFL